MTKWLINIEPGFQERGATMWKVFLTIAIGKLYNSKDVSVSYNEFSQFNWKLYFRWLIALLQCHPALVISSLGVHKPDTNAVPMQQWGIIASCRLANPERRKNSDSLH